MTVKLSEVIDRWIIENESLVREIRDYKDEYKNTKDFSGGFC